MQPRHWGLALSFLLMVLAPLMVVAWYLWAVATDQYASTTGFTVRQEENSGAVDLLGNFARMAGGSVGGDSGILYEYILSQDMVTRVDKALDLRAIYAAEWPGDPLFALDPEATIEELLAYWQRIIRVSYDEGSGLIELRVLAFDPATAQRIGQQIVVESELLINELNARARADTMRYAEADLETALARVKAAREAMTRFRSRTQILDPESDLQGRMGVLANLQQELATALIEYDLLRESSSVGDPRLEQVNRRIDVIRARIIQERRNVTSDDGSTIGEDYPTLMAEYESLTVDREFAEKSYTAALAQRDMAQANANRESRYLATFVKPTLPQTAEYPQRLMLFGLSALFLGLSWSILSLVYYSLRDRR